MPDVTSPSLGKFGDDVLALLDSDADFRASFKLDPIAACEARFGSAAMPNEGEYVIKGDDGTLAIVLPKSNLLFGFDADLNLVTDVANKLGDQGVELPDELLDLVSGGGASGRLSETAPKEQLQS